MNGFEEAAPERCAVAQGEQTADGATPDATSGARLRLCWDAAVGEAGGALLLEPGLASVGSHPQNTVVLRDRLVSRFHCRLHLREDGRLWLRDLGSRNGTSVDGAQVAEAELLAGAVVGVGGRSLRVERESLAAPPRVPGFSTRDPAMAPALALIARAGPSRLPVVLRGETGAGKEVAARALHALSDRARGPFVPLNCGAIASELAEAELFGHERGAFTGAVGTSPGAFGAADGGTLFLDEVGELPLPLQVKLLRALEAEEVRPVGAARPRKIDVRVVCATHRDLRALVAAGSFREDLWYRLRGVEIALPPLRARKLDLLPLAAEFLAEEPGVRLTADARAALLAHSWPGNVRELKLVVRLALLLREGEVIRKSDLRLDPEPGGCGASTAPPLPTRVSEADAPVGPVPARGDEPLALAGRTLDDLEAAAIRASFQRHGGVRRAMVRELGIAKSSLLRKLDALGLRETAVLQSRA